ncbi:hypothetical protein BH11BAC2_BH11BAC2_07260 [soil metagenome]
MSLQFINRPEALKAEYYKEAVELIGEQFSKVDGVITVYSFGNVTTPGISDLDILLVFEDQHACVLNGFENLPERYQPLFTHRIMALCASHFSRNNHYTLWSEHRLISGKHPTINTALQKTEEQLRLLKRQTAIEFLVANYIDLKVQIDYGIIKLRSFLQHMKGLLYDLDFLEITSSKLHAPLLQLKQWIINWFEQTPKDQEIIQWINSFIPLFDDFVNHILRNEPVYFPEMQTYRVSKNMQLHNSDQLSYSHSGILLPSLFSHFSKKFFKLQNRLNTFDFYLPITTIPSDPIIEERFRFLQEMKNYNRKFLPNFMTHTTSITSKLI